MTREDYISLLSEVQRAQRIKLMDGLSVEVDAKCNHFNATFYDFKHSVCDVLVDIESDRDEVERVHAFCRLVEDYNTLQR